MNIGAYPVPLATGAMASEMAVTFDQGRRERVLVVPALFDEGHKLRRLAIGVMRRLDGAGIDAILPDLPGCNESAQDLALIEPEDWATAMHAAARHFGANRVLAMRGGGLIVPPGIGGWHYAPVSGASLLKTMVRARLIALREAGKETTAEKLLAQGMDLGLDLGGYSLSGEMLRQLQMLVPGKAPGISAIEHELIGGRPLWLRAEPDDDPAQADALAAVVSVAVRA